MDAGNDHQAAAGSFESAFDVGAETLAYQIMAGMIGRRTRMAARTEAAEPGPSRSLLRQAKSWLGFG